MRPPLPHRWPGRTFDAVLYEIKLRGAGRPRAFLPVARSQPCVSQSGLSPAAFQVPLLRRVTFAMLSAGKAAGINQE